LTFASPTLRPRAGYFSHHGLWAPGVRLFRRLGFPAKAGLISLVFLLPLVVLLVAYLRTSAETIGFARHEQAGVALLRAIEPWLIAVQKERRLVLTGAKPQVDVAALEAVIAPVKALVGERPDGLDVSTALAQAVRQHDAVRALPAGGASAAALQAYVDGVLEMRHVVLDQSALTLDPDQDTYYLMTLATDVVGSAIESVSRSRALAAQVPPAGQPAQPQALRELYAVWQSGAAQAAAIAPTVARAAEPDPALAAGLQADAVVQATQAYLKAAEAAWFGASFDAQLAVLNGPGQQAVDQLRGLGQRSLDQLSQRLQARIDRVAGARNAVVVITAVSLLAVAYLFIAFFRVMKGGLDEVSRHLQAMTEGDLTTSPRPWGRDEAAELMLLLAAMQDALRTMVRQVRGASDGIVHASTEIAGAAHDLSARTEQTASSLQESASAMEEISATVQHTADHAGEATTIAADNARLAERGGRVMAQMTDTMARIHQSSRQIGDIIGTIDGIAFQTNILALNAAVEAARAGEQGRGFAVVASEVRSLAQRSAEAARQIKTLIGGSVEQVEAGNGVVREAGDAIAAIVQGATRVNGLLADIARGAREQADGVAQIGTAVQDLDRNTQQNAAMVEETAAAAGSLNQKALDLAAEVQRFQLPA
jgi:methyl-accepting chemotaxis protein